MMDRYVVAFYELDRRYGGPEEGGWWYTTGELTRPLGVYRTEDAAYKAARRANRLLDKIQRRKSIYSTAYSGGRFEAHVYQNHAPAYFPERRPTYE